MIDHPSKGTPGSPVAADGRRHDGGKPCPPLDGQLGWYLTEDAHMWCPITGNIDQIAVERMLERAFPESYRRRTFSSA